MSTLSSQIVRQLLKAIPSLQVIYLFGSAETDHFTTVERCIARIREDYDEEFRRNYTKQDAIILNLERACQACIDMATMEWRRTLSKPKSSVFPRPVATCFRC